MLLNIMIMSQG